MACVDNGVMELESVFTEALRQSTALSIDGDTLTIAYPDGILRFTRMGGAAGGTTNLDGSSWQLTEYGQEGSLTTAIGESTVVFGPGDKIGGNGGCNSFGGTYTFDGTTLTVSNLASTEMACADNALMQQESAFTGALAQATGLTIDGDTLTITYPDGILRFTLLAGAGAAAPIEGTTWNLESIVTGTGADGSASSVVAGSTVTAQWNNGTVSGSAGCNQYSANYTLDGDTLEVGDVVTTRMACDGLMEQETAFVNALDNATGLKIDNGKLVLTHPNGELVFTAAQ